jgi:hypothetical protein
MPFGLPSEAASLAFLGILLVAAMIIAFAHRGAPLGTRTLPAACVDLALQALHVAEEFSAGFHVRAPALFGLPPWSPDFFVWINMAAIAAWTLALAAIASGRPNVPAIGLLWFLALASIGNALWHPATSIALGGYFPGTATAVPLGLAGLVLATALAGRRQSGPA